VEPLDRGRVNHGAGSRVSTRPPRRGL